MLPADLRTAELELHDAVRAALAAEPKARWTAELRFEGLRPLPMFLRLLAGLNGEVSVRLLFADAGATALARRDGAELASLISSYGDQRRRQQEARSEGTLLLAGASQAEYDEVEALCSVHDGAVVFLNPALEDAAVGIGSVARQRRRGLLATLQTAYALIPMPEGALRRAFPSPWELYRLDPDGFRLAGRFEQRPDREEQFQVLSGQTGGGIASNLRALDSLLEGLQN